MSSRHGRSDRDPRSGTGPAKRQPLNEYFIDGEGILREVLQSEICRFLGAEATCRPGEYNGRQGFKIKAIRPFTPEMLEDLKAASRDFRTENRTLQERYREEVSYEESETRRRNDPQLSHGSHGSHGFGGSSSSSYTVGSPYSESPGYANMPAYSAGSNYPSGSGPGFPSGTGQYAPSGYSMAPSMSGNTSYAGGNDPRGYSSHYTYGSQPPPRGYEQHGASERGYYAPPGYPEPPRSRGEPLPQGFAYARAPNERPPMGDVPRDYPGDTEMGGTSFHPGYGGAHRGQPSPYDVNREHYGGRPQPDQYAGGNRRR